MRSVLLHVLLAQGLADELARLAADAPGGDAEAAGAALCAALRAQLLGMPPLEWLRPPMLSKLP